MFEPEVVQFGSVEDVDWMFQLRSEVESTFLLSPMCVPMQASCPPPWFKLLVDCRLNAQASQATTRPVCHTQPHFLSVP
jgi:hypothetical protein